MHDAGISGTVFVVFQPAYPIQAVPVRSLGQVR